MRKRLVVFDRWAAVQVSLCGVLSQLHKECRSVAHLICVICFSFEDWAWGGAASFPTVCRPSWRPRRSRTGQLTAASQRRVHFCYLTAGVAWSDATSTSAASSAGAAAASPVVATGACIYVQTEKKRSVDVFDFVRVARIYVYC